MPRIEWQMIYPSSIETLFDIMSILQFAIILRLWNAYLRTKLRVSCQSARYYFLLFDNVSTISLRELSPQRNIVLIKLMDWYRYNKDYSNCSCKLSHLYYFNDTILRADYKVILFEGCVRFHNCLLIYYYIWEREEKVVIIFSQEYL